jgi:Skp family chaperone for outer membrane proteins
MMMTFLLRFALLLCFLSITACSSMYYSGLEKIGIPKRELMVHRVEKARDTQEQTKEQFKSALSQFTAVTQFNGGDLESIYNQLNDEYEASVEQATLIQTRIDDIKEVSEALFDEWADEIEQYNSASLKRNSQRQLSSTKRQYRQLINAMEQAESKLEPVLIVFKDQVLYLKHNLNARAISALKNELSGIQSDVSLLIAAMETSIDEANAFISSMENK